MHLDIVVFLLFVLTNVCIGIASIYRVSTFQHYAVGSKEFTTAAIVTSILTMSYGGGIFYTPFDIYSLLFFTGRTISYFIIGTLLSHRLYFFLNNQSIAETMGKLYGTTVRKVVAVCALLHNVAVIALQIKILSIVISCAWDIQEHYTLCLAAIFISFSIGSHGIRSLTLLSAVRCATFGILFPTIAWVLWKNLITQCHADQFSLAFTIKNSWNTLINIRSTGHYITFFIAYAIPCLNPALFQHVLISENTTQIKRSFNYAGLFTLSINLFLLWIALLVNSNKLDLSNTYLHYFNAYWGVKGLFMLAVATLTLSSANIYLHGATVLVVNDIQNVFKRDKTSAMNFSGYTAAIGLLAALVALYVKDPLQLWNMAIVTFKPIVGIPLLIHLLGVQLHRYTVLMGMLITTITIILLEYFRPNLGIHQILFYILMHLCTLIIVQTAHIFLKKYKQKSDGNILAIVFFKEEALALVSLWTRFSAHILRKITKFDLMDYLQNQLPKHNLYYVLFSFYITVTAYCSLYTFSSNAIWSAKLEAFILFPSLFVSTFFLAYASIPSKSYLTKIALVIWPLSNFYFLFLVSSGMVVLSKFAHLQVIIFMLNICLSTFTSPLIIIFFRFLISIIAIWIWIFYFGNNVKLIDAFFNLNISVVYIILMIFILLGSLLSHEQRLRKLLVTIQELRSSQEEQNARQFFSKQQVAALAYESDCVIKQLHNTLLRLLTSKEHKHNLAYAIEKQSIRLKKYFDSIFSYLKHNLYLETNWISIDQLLAECFNAIKINDIYHSPYVTIHTEHLYIQCDIERIKSLIINGLYSCKLYESMNSNKRRDISIYINDTQLGYRLTLLHGKIQKVHAVSFMITTTTERPAILPLYKVVEMADVQILNKEKEQDQLNAESHHIVNAHYGYCDITHSDLGITHLYVIPVNLQEITKAFAAFSPVVYTQSVKPDSISMQQEAIFFEKVKGTGLAVQNIMDVLQLIKTYYATQKRKTGELFYLHPMAVATILLDLTEDTHVIIAGLAHDVVQNTPLTEAGLTTILGENITQMLFTVELIEKHLPLRKNDYPAYIKSIINDKYHNAILVKLADVLHNAKTIHGHSIEKQIEKATLIQEFYVPLAQAMHLTKVAHTLHIYASKVLNIALI
ncbi:HD domain-containing protein [Candidatus Cardinium hertigii]|jgi:Na+/proline symporter|uniref:HD domain-containing protein n=1 Tax=Candidatus Cardinium hertigii TaxID=247481 RepID=A0A3N2QB50_9BACT|nr:HD domain-containing protein [Candidatus Cardinium hertigii]ROT47025.1 HD domain-containing protein [Candidatus Cardinium hertigii]